MPDALDRGIYRLIDANADRATEALRVVGDITRFVLEREELAIDWRSIRSEFWTVYGSVAGLQRRGLQSRDSQNDIGRVFPSARYQDIQQLVLSNIHRAQEAFRVLEEAMRSVDVSVVSQFADLRYRCYELEPATVSLLDQWTHAGKLDFSLYVVLGNEFSKGRDFVEVTNKAIDGGAGCIQLRDKQMSRRDLLGWAYRLREITRERNVTFIINDYIDIAMAVDADGVHLGQGDFPLVEARRIMGPHAIIGASTHNVDQARRAAAEGASYINIGPIFSTSTKDTPVTPVTPDMIETIRREVCLPFTVMGGIKLDNIEQVLEKGAHRIAVVTAVVAQDDIAAAARSFSERIETWLSGNASE